MTMFKPGQWMINTFAALLSILFATLPASSQTEEAAWSALQKGGIVLFRHALAPGTGDPANFTLGDCATQRNLNGAGRADAQRIGDLFREKAIPVNKVLTSQWCRCRETAQLAFPGLVEESPTFNSFFGDRSSEPQQSAEAKRLMEQWDGPGTLVIVTHQVNITALTGIFPSSGEGIVVRMEQGKVQVVGRLRL